MARLLHNNNRVSGMLSIPYHTFQLQKENFMKAMQKGFTLIELMIVVAIVGILAAIALPAYNDYMVRSKLTEPLAALDAAKTSIAEFAATNMRLPSTAASAGVSNPASAKYSSALTWNFGNTRLEVTLANLNGDLNGDELCMIAAFNSSDNTIGWTCGTNAGTTDYKYIPSNCRNPCP